MIKTDNEQDDRDLSNIPAGEQEQAYGWQESRPVQPLLKRVIGTAGAFLGHTRHKLASWYNDNGEQSYTRHIDV